MCKIQAERLIEDSYSAHFRKVAWYSYDIANPSKQGLSIKTFDLYDFEENGPCADYKIFSHRHFIAEIIQDYYKVPEEYGFIIEKVPNERELKIFNKCDLVRYISLDTYKFSYMVDTWN